VISDDELFSQMAGMNWDEYWRALFTKVEVEDIESYEKSYKNSELEQQDVIENYKKYKGDMMLTLDAVPLCSDEDLQRFIDIIENSIKNDGLQRFPGFEKSIKKFESKKGKRKMKRDEEAKEIEELTIPEKGSKVEEKEEENDLNKQIKQKRHVEWDALTATLSEKYSKKSNGNKKTGYYPEPSEEEFMNASKRLEKRRK